MAFISARGTDEISDILSTINSKFYDDYGKAVKDFKGRITVFKPFKDEVVTFLHDKIRELQNNLDKAHSVLNDYERQLKEVAEKITTKPKKPFISKIFKKRK